VIDRLIAGRYRITEKIGIGGMAEVFRATDETLGRTVAIKVMLPQYATDETFAIRFRQEAQAAANLQSPYIVNIYDWGFEQADQTYFIVMEYVRGTDLKTAIEQRGAINQHKVAEIGAQVCAALNVAHGYDIIHRDIKPHNIMIQPDGNAKVMDFGIARANDANMTQTGSVLGTAYYVSPEQAQGKALTPATDIYSLGIVLYEAATGKVPFDGPDAVSIAVKQVNEQPRLPRRINPDIDADLGAIILKAMQKRPGDRFSTAEQMRQALLKYLNGQPLGTIDSNARTRVISTPAVIPVAEATAVMPKLTTPGTITKIGNPSSGQSQPKRNSKTPWIVALVSILAVAAIGIVLYFVFFPLQEPQTEVPKIVGMNQDQANQALRSAGLELGDVREETSPSVAIGYIITQNPAAGAKVTQGGKVDIVLSRGTGSVVVPDLTGRSPAEAEAELKALNLSYTAGSSRPDASIAKGLICAQSPAAENQVAEGTSVICDISTGPETALISNVYGMTKDNAANLLTTTGFKVAYAEDVYSSAVDAGQVVSQDKSGEAVKGTTVTLTISKGPEPAPEVKVTVPNIVGMDVNAASNALSSQGLSLDYTGSAAGKIVKSQDPKPNTSVLPGSTVKVIFEGSDNPSGSGTQTGGSGSTP
jgi:serine/threonine-protein kinase